MSERIDALPLTPEQTNTVSGLANGMLAAGAMSVVWGLTNLVANLAKQAALDNSLGNLVVNFGCGTLVFLIPLTMGFWLLAGSRAFKAVVETDEGDQDYLVEGLGKLRNVMVLKCVMLLMIALFFVVMVVAGGMLAMFIAGIAAMAAGS